MRHKSETLLACLTLLLTGLHFVIETYYHFKFQQSLQALIVDYIWNALAIFAVIMSLKVRPRSAAGLLAASWAYALGFAWRSIFGRLEAWADGVAPGGEPKYFTDILVVALWLVGFCLLWSLWLTWREVMHEASKL